MLELNAHPNTRAIIEAWKRLSSGESSLQDTPKASEYPEIVSRLFIIQRTQKEDLTFRVAGAGLESLFGRDLIDHNFLSLWRDADKVIVSAAVDAALIEGSPTVMQATAETLDGRQVGVEVSFSPLDTIEAHTPRVLGLYQTTTNEAVLKQRPIWRHVATRMTPPVPETLAASLRLVVSNDT